MRQLSGTDTLMLYSEAPNAQNTIAPIAIYDPSTASKGEVSFDDIMALIESRLDVSESFRERLVTVPFGLDRPSWIRDPDFDLEYHVRQIALPKPGNWRQFCTQVARIGARPLDMTRPPWELYVIEGLDDIEGIPKNSFATMLKLHHAAVDGVSGAEIVNALNDNSPDPNERDTGKRSKGWKPERLPSEAELLARAGVHLMTRPLAIARVVLPVVRSVRESRKPKDPGRQVTGPLPATRFNHSVSPHRVWDARRFDLAEVKRIRSGVEGASVNDVAIAIIGGAMRRYLENKGELPETSLVTLMPISVRPTMAQSARRAEEKAEAGGNSFAMTAVPMATDIEDPIERLAEIHRNTEEAKAYAVDAPSLTEISEALPGALMGTVQRALIRRANRAGRAMGVHTITTNVPGPQVPMYCCGAKAVFMTGMAPVGEGVGIINGVGSYNGELAVSFTADRDMMPDPDLYASSIDAAFEELRDRTA
jgi:diacylglycerol O-acyltransferase / wax synthase